MTHAGTPAPIGEIAARDLDDLGAIRDAKLPTVIRGLANGWPAVAAARIGDGAVADYLLACEPRRRVSAIVADPAEDGRLFYDARLTGLNFRSVEGELAAFLRDLLHGASDDAPPALAVQSAAVDDLFSRFSAENGLSILPGVAARIWIGNRVRVATHFDLLENVACCVAGRRRFTLFAPDQIANLYPGPFEITPAGTPVSMVDLSDPDWNRFPRFRTAWAQARQATLEPGDAIYIPYGWWHGVESLAPLNILVNYWWSDVPGVLGGPYQALAHAMLAFRHLPPAERDIWRGMIDHYVFERDGDPAAHLPDHARGMLGPPSPALFARLRPTLAQRPL